MAADYEVSAHYVSSLAKVLEQERLLQVCPPAAAPVLENPWARRWWPGSAVEAVFVAVRRHAGDERLEAVGQALLKQHMLPGLVPAVSWLLSRSGARPSTLLSRLDLLSGTLLRGVGFEWQAEGTAAGVVRVRYPQPAQDPLAVVGVWRGIFEQVFELTRSTGQVVHIGSENGVLEARLRWG